MHFILTLVVKSTAPRVFGPSLAPSESPVASITWKSGKPHDKQKKKAALTWTFKVRIIETKSKSFDNILWFDIFPHYDATQSFPSEEKFAKSDQIDSRTHLHDPCYVSSLPFGERTNVPEPRRLVEIDRPNLRWPVVRGWWSESTNVRLAKQMPRQVQKVSGFPCDFADSPYSNRFIPKTRLICFVWSGPIPTRAAIVFFPFFCTSNNFLLLENLP